ncbi:MAG: M48 family metallopeptidase [Candidatus Spyradosoma sp.]
MSPENFEISLGSAGTVSVALERSRRIRRMTLRVLPDGRVSVVVPESMRGDALAKARKFADANALWLRRALAKAARRDVPAPRALSAFLRERPAVSAFGKSFALEFGTASIEPFFVFRESSPVAVFCLRAGNEDADAETLLRKFAQTTLPPRARALADARGVSVGKISVRAQRSRWGSCTAEGALSLNWRLVLLPPELQDHVILHELAHRVHMDHSGEFWDLLNAWDPGAGTHDIALTRTWAPLIFSVAET